MELVVHLAHPLIVGARRGREDPGALPLLLREGGPDRAQRDERPPQVEDVVEAAALDRVVLHALGHECCVVVRHHGFLLRTPVGYLERIDHIEGHVAHPLQASQVEERGEEKGESRGEGRAREGGVPHLREHHVAKVDEADAAREALVEEDILDVRIAVRHSERRLEKLLDDVPMAAPELWHPFDYGRVHVAVDFSESLHADLGVVHESIEHKASKILSGME